MIVCGFRALLSSCLRVQLTDLIYYFAWFEEPIEGEDDSRSDSGASSDGDVDDDDEDGIVVHRNNESGSRELRRQVHMRHKFVDKGDSDDKNFYTPKGMSQSPYKGAYQCPYCTSIYSFRGRR